MPSPTLTVLAVVLRSYELSYSQEPWTHEFTYDKIKPWKIYPWNLIRIWYMLVFYKIYDSNALLCLDLFIGGGDVEFVATCTSIW